jgi:hypothetical protein
MEKMTKPPAVPATAPALRPSLQEGIARLRAATGKPEKRVVFRMCSIERKSFTVAYERTDPRERFKIALIEKTDPVAGKGVAQATGASSEADKATSFSIEEFDHTGMSCPWCGDRRGMIYHDTCDTNFCAGAQTVRADGTPQFRCPICQVQFGLQAADTLHGKSVAAGSGPMRTDNRLTTEANTLLPRRR